MRRLLNGWRAGLVLALLIGLWELYADLGSATRRLILPAPHQVVKALYADRGLLWSNLLVTGEEVLLGIAVAMVASLALAVLIHFSRSARGALYPLLIGSQAIPIAAIAPVLVLWLGFGLLPKLLVIALVSFFPIVVTTLAGLAAVDPELPKLMRTFDASRLAIFRHVEAPSALPSLLTGAKIAVTVSVIGAYLAELSGSSSGLGFIYQQAQAQDLMPRAYAAVLILCLFAIALFGVLGLAERMATPWAYQRRGDSSR